MQGTAEFGRLLVGDAEASGRGIAAIATKRLVDAAFGPWRLRAVALKVREQNTRAIAICEACGFEEVGWNNGVVEMRVTSIG